VTNYYNAGLAIQPVRRNTPTVYQVGSSIIDIKWPGQIRDEYRKVNAEFQTLQRELVEQIKQGLTPDQNAWITSTWQPFSSEWFKTYADHGQKSGLSNWIANPGYGDWENAQTWRSKLRDIWNSARAVGFALHSPAPTLPDPGPLNTLIDGIKSIIKYLVIGALLVGGGWLLYQNLVKK